MDWYTITTIDIKKIEKGIGTKKSPDKKFYDILRYTKEKSCQEKSCLSLIPYFPSF